MVQNNKTTITLKRTKGDNHSCISIITSVYSVTVDNRFPDSHIKGQAAETKEGTAPKKRLAEHVVVCI